MKLIRDVDRGSTSAEFGGEVTLDASVCYDFVVSLRALFNPRTFTRSRRWAADQLPRLSDDLVAKGRFLFQGLDTALGYGAARVIKELSPGAGPADLIAAIAAMRPDELAMFLLDTGDTRPDRREAFRQVLSSGSAATVKDAVSDLSGGWANRCRKVLLEPDVVQADLVTLLDGYLAAVFNEHLSETTGLVERAADAARSTLDALPAAAAIEHLTGGYSLGPDIEVRTVTLAPSVFMYPFMSTRTDEASGDAFIIFGVHSDMFDSYDPVPMRAELVTALKVMADPNRLTLLRLLADRPRYTTELVSLLKLGQPTVHHHLHQLRTAGLVRQQRDRNGMKYSMRGDVAADILRSLEQWLLRPGGGSEPTDDEHPTQP